MVGGMPCRDGLRRSRSSATSAHERWSSAHVPSVLPSSHTISSKLEARARAASRWPLTTPATVTSSLWAGITIESWMRVTLGHGGHAAGVRQGANRAKDLGADRVDPDRAALHRRAEPRHRVAPVEAVV